MNARTLAAVLVTSALLAGCMGTPDVPEVDDTGSDDGTGTDTGGDAPGDGGEQVSWAQYAYDREVDPASGRSGKVQSYSYRNTQEENGEKTVIDVDVEVLGTETENVRVRQPDFATGDFDGKVVEVPVRVHKLKHTIEVVQDDTGDREAGDTGVVTLWIPADSTGPQGTYLWNFVRMEEETDDGTNVWEYYTTEEMQNDGNVYMPYTEGDDVMQSWTWDYLMGTYGWGLWSTFFADTTTLEEGSYNFGGVSYVSKRERLEVGDYAFDGWRVTWGAVSGGEGGGWTVAMAPQLPMAYEYAFSSRSGDTTSLMSYKLTDLELG